MMEPYCTPEMEVVYFDQEDIITTSNDKPNYDLPFVPIVPNAVNEDEW